VDFLTFLALLRPLRSTFVDAPLLRLTQEGERRFRLVFEVSERRLPLVIGLADRRPWIGIPPPARRHRGPSGSFAGIAARELQGAVLRGLEGLGDDRVLRLEFANGQALVAELSGPAPNLVRLDRDGRVQGMARWPKSARSRLRPGEPYAAPSHPEGRTVPTRATAEELDRVLDRARGEGLDLEQALRRKLFGVGPETARLVVDESVARGVGAGTVLVERIERLRTGLDAPAVARTRLWPWPPTGVDAAELHQGPDAARTVGRFHAAADEEEEAATRLRGLRTILARQIRRLESARDKVERDRRTFADPDRHRRLAEALLAGMHDATRVGDHALVTDPYDAGRGQISVPAPARLSLPDAAELLFKRHRRARRGLEAAEERDRTLVAKLGALASIRAAHAETRGPEAADELERVLREAGLPVGLEVVPTSGRPAARSTPRLEGVRVFTSSDGWMLLVGKGGKENHRLTFKLAGPEDFWLHARGCPGAHVVIRNPERRKRPPQDTLEEAAALAAWYSDAREEGAADVQWTRRKNVRKARNAPPGTVLVKRFETVRIRPGLPAVPRDLPGGEA
jgi:predicted ribosome quality control (RQC) complex YloA/Tae2 family protein